MSARRKARPKRILDFAQRYPQGYPQGYQFVSLSVCGSWILGARDNPKSTIQNSKIE
jgi:hypothetical protein